MALFAHYRLGGYLKILLPNLLQRIYTAYHEDGRYLKFDFVNDSSVPDIYYDYSAKSGEITQNKLLIFCTVKFVGASVYSLLDLHTGGV